MRQNVVIGFLGTQLDAGKKVRWRPSMALTMHETFPVDRLELLHDNKFRRLAHRVKEDIQEASPDTEVMLRRLDLKNPWDFEEVYGALFDFARTYGFDEDREEYHVHLTTGTHVAQICWFLLTESRHIPARLLQTSPPPNRDGLKGSFTIVDLDLSKYNALQQRFDLVSADHTALLKAGIKTRNADFNAIIDQIEQISVASDAPLLLLGATGTGKTELAARIYDLKRQQRRVRGRFVHVNCSTLRGERALSTLFGHKKGAFGASGSDRKGLLREADNGLLFLDEIDQLGLDEQAMILDAIESGTFFPLGSDHEVRSQFHVIAGANRDLAKLVADGRFRADLFARLNFWTFRLPALKDRREDIEPNIEFELARAERTLGNQTGFNADASQRYLRFALDPATVWPGNFRDLSASIQRLCTLAPRGRITLNMVNQEVERLEGQWAAATSDPDMLLIQQFIGPDVRSIDPFDRVQLAEVIRVCQASKSLSAAGRTLFSASLATRTTRNDADRLRKYLDKFGLSWAQITH
ncbi:RNA repair transcriptional activator RtcR [Coralliovum pocilloporae]|uniref:RNA repair transcriptional activator RtcR n=1 Tax=Coralliovum pocilloporae TaxID=3066369 RepID=UPI003306D2E8